MTRLYTEDTQRERILAILDKFEEAYTIIPAIGAWRGVHENSLIIELSNAVSLAEAETIAEEIATANEQDAVLLTRGNFEELIQAAA